MAHQQFHGVIGILDGDGLLTHGYQLPDLLVQMMVLLFESRHFLPVAGLLLFGHGPKFLQFVADGCKVLIAVPESLELELLAFELDGELLQLGLVGDLDAAQLVLAVQLEQLQLFLQLLEEVLLRGRLPLLPLQLLRQPLDLAFVVFQLLVHEVQLLLDFFELGCVGTVELAGLPTSVDEHDEPPKVDLQVGLVLGPVLVPADVGLLDDEHLPVLVAHLLLEPAPLLAEFLRLLPALLQLLLDALELFEFGLGEARLPELLLGDLCDLLVFGLEDGELLLGEGQLLLEGLQFGAVLQRQLLLQAQLPLQGLQVLLGPRALLRVLLQLLLDDLQLPHQLVVAALQLAPILCQRPDLLGVCRQDLLQLVVFHGQLLFVIAKMPDS